MNSHVAMIRAASHYGHELVGCCFTEDGAGLMCVGEEDSWLEECSTDTSVVLDTSGPVQLSDPDEVAALAAWLSAAAVWLRMRMLEQEDDSCQD